MKTAKSIASQDYPDIEWIVKDGNSIDNPIPDAKKIVEGRVKFTDASGPDQSIYDAMNIGVSSSTGDFVVFLNAGDIFSDDTSLRNVVTAIEAKGAEVVDILYGGANLVLPNGDSVYRAPRDADRTLWHGLPANHQATYFRRTKLVDEPYDLSYRVCGDYYLVAVLEKAGAESICLDEPVVDFMVGGFSFTSPWLLHMEPAKIQRKVLEQSILLVGASMIRRMVTTVVLACLVLAKRKTKPSLGTP